MSITKGITLATIAAGTLLAATPSQAVVTSFAAYTNIKGDNTYFTNSGKKGTGGTKGELYTISAPANKTAGAAKVDFVFTSPTLSQAFIDDTKGVAAFTLDATVTATPATTLRLGSTIYIAQENFTGSFSFISTAPITIGSKTYAVGANLLSGTFDTGTIFGKKKGTSGSLSADTRGGSNIAYASDFLSFTSSINRDFAFSLTSILSPLNAATNAALNTFNATSTGSFSSDPAPTVIGAPEPATLGVVGLGLGLLGLRSRRRAA